VNLIFDHLRINLQFVLFCFTVTGVKEIKYRVNTISKVKQEKMGDFLDTFKED